MLNGVQSEYNNALEWINTILEERLTQWRKIEIMIMYICPE